MKSVQQPELYSALSKICPDIADFGIGFGAAQAPPNWTITAALGTIAFDQDGLSLLTQAADNAIASAIVTTKHWLPAAGKSCIFQASLKPVEAATNACNVYCGLTSSTAATSIGNDGAGPAASYSGFGFFKVDGSLNWWVEASLAGVQITAELTATNSLDTVAHLGANGSYQVLEIDAKIKTSTKIDVVFKIDGVPVYKLTDYVWTNLVAMAPVISVRSGSVTAETLRVKYAAIVKNR